MTEPLPLETAQRILPRNRQASDNKMLTYYFRITPDNRLLFGGRARFALSSPDSDLKSAEILKRAMGTVFPYPGLDSRRLHVGWSGGSEPWTRWCTPDKHNGVHYSLGYSGHGVQMATYMGKQMALSMLGKPSAEPLGATSRTGPCPATSGRPGSFRSSADTPSSSTDSADE